MTKPNLANDKTGGVRTYSWPPAPPHEFEVVSVTSALDGGLPKPALIGWAAKVTAEFAVSNHAIVGHMLEAKQKKEAIEYVKRARWASSGAKADRGTTVHAALEAHVAGRPLTKATIEGMLEEKSVPQNLWRGTGGMIEGLMRFLDDEAPEILWSENTAFSRTHGYAGTPDVIVRMMVGDSVVPVVIDVKTSARVYDDTALQLAAYANADFIGLDDGTEAPLVHRGRGKDGVYVVDGLEKIKYGVVVRPTASGSYEKVVFNLTEGVFSLFLACLYTATHRASLEQTRRP